MGGTDLVNDAAHLSRLTDWCECMHAYMYTSKCTHLYTPISIMHSDADYMWQLEAVVTMTRLIFALIWTFPVTPELQLVFFNCTSQHTAK